MDFPVTFRAYLFFRLLVRVVTVNAERKKKVKEGSLADLKALYNDQLLNFFIVNKNRQNTKQRILAQVSVQGIYKKISK